MISQQKTNHFPINRADTFPIRSRCPKCGSYPDIESTNYDYRTFYHHWKNVHHEHLILFTHQYKKRSKATLFGKGVTPRFHKNVRFRRLVGAASVLDLCACLNGHRQWAYRGWDNDKLENFHRKSKFDY